MATPNAAAANGHVGKVVQIIGPVLDVEFQGGYLPPIYQALRVVSEGFDVPTPIDVIAEVQQHLGEGRVRTVSMTPTDGMVRGMMAIDTGGPITMPVGEGTLGRVLNVIGEPVDTLGLEVGYRLIPLVDKTQNGELLGRIKSIRKKIAAIGPAGHTLIFPAVEQSYLALRNAKARAKHVILLTDGQASSEGIDRGSTFTIRIPSPCVVEQIATPTTAPWRIR